MKDVKLVSFQFCSDLSDWESEKFVFADSYTIFHDENGAGKTPVMNGIAYALGFSKRFARDVNENVDYVELVLSVNGVEHRVTRYLEEMFSCQIYRENKLLKKIEGDQKNKVPAEFTDFMYELFEVPNVRVASCGTAEKRYSTRIYISQLIPMFYISQTTGWNHVYVPLEKEGFVQDQPSEVARLFLGMAPLNPLDDNNEKQRMYRTRSRLRDEIISLKNKISFYQDKLGKNAALSLDEIGEIRDQSEDQVKDIKSVVTGLESEDGYLEKKLREKSKERSKIKDSIYRLRAKLCGLEDLSDELVNKTKVAEDCYDIKDSFEKFCGNPDCGLLRKRGVPFAKKILYLKDQQKDIEASIAKTNEALREEEKKIDDLDLEVDQLHGERGDLGSDESFSSLAAEVEKFVYFSEAYNNREALETFSKNLIVANDEYNRIQSALEAFSKGNSLITEEDIRKIDTFTHSLKKWLHVLKTPNIDIDGITVDRGMKIEIDDAIFQRDSEQDGSTRNRIILSYHTALLETSLAHNGIHPKFLLIDTPGKDETNKDHLFAYFSELRSLSKKYKTEVQVVVAFKDSVINEEDDDTVYKAKFVNEKGARHYLGDFTK